MNIKNQYEENGYKIIEYDNGAIVKELILEDSQQDIKENLEILLDEELDKIELKEKIDYLTTLLELQGGMLSV